MELTVNNFTLPPSQKVVVVELSVGSASRWLVLGVGGEHITPLATLDAPAGVPASFDEHIKLHADLTALLFAQGFRESEIAS